MKNRRLSARPITCRLPRAKKDADYLTKTPPLLASQPRGRGSAALINRSENSGDIRNISLDLSQCRWFELARGVEVRVFAAHSRRIPSTKPKILQVSQLVPRLWGGIASAVQLIIRSAIILIIGSVVMASRPDKARILSEHRRGNGGGKNYYSTERFHFGHLASSVLSCER
jgi:hypothetical protein